MDWYIKTLEQKFSGVEFQIILQTTPPGDAPSSSRSFTVVRAYRATQKGSKGKDLDIYGKNSHFTQSQWTLY